MIGDPLKPSNPDLIKAEQICQKMRDLALVLPKSKTIDKERHVEQFLNNFYFLFSGGEVSRRYLKKAENLYGDKWLEFLKNNVTLIDQTKDVLRRWQPYSTLMDFYIELCKLKQWDLVDSINEEINLHGMGLDKWDELNPLLEKAGDAMKVSGINPELFSS